MKLQVVPVLSALLILIFIFPGCENSTGVNPEANKLSVNVKDPSGNPLSDVKIFIVYDFDISGFKNEKMIHSNPLEISSVVLENFEAELIENNVVLHWTTSSETNNQGFYVECKYSNGEFYSKGFVHGNGNSDTVSNYVFTEWAVPGTAMTFRLKIVEFDGSYEYSNEILIYGPPSPYPAQLMQNYPNPFAGYTNIHYDIRKNSLVSFDIYNFKNEMIHPSFLVDTANQRGSYVWTADFSQVLPSGGYKLVMNIDEGDSVYSDEIKMISTYTIYDSSIASLDTSIYSSLPNGVTNNGRFEMNNEDFPFGMEYIRTGEADPSPYGKATVKNSITLILYKSGYKSLMRYATINSGKALNLNFTMEEE